MFYFVGVSSDLGRALNSSNMKFDSPKMGKMFFFSNLQQKTGFTSIKFLKEEEEKKIHNNLLIQVT